MDHDDREHSGHASVEEPVKMEIPSEFKEQLTQFYESYLEIPEALANDDLESARAATKETMTALEAIDMKLLEGRAHMEWMKHRSQFKQAGNLLESADIEEIRKGLIEFSAQLPETMEMFGLNGGEDLYVLRCPMANNGKGAIWLQRDKTTRNPFYGQKMPTCGSVIETLANQSNPQGGHDH